VISHLSKAGDSWENFVYRNGFTLPENVTDLPLHFDEPPSPCRPNPPMENLHVNLQEIPTSIDQTPVVIQKPSKGKKPKHDFIPRKYLEEVLDDLKDKILTVPNPEPIQIDLNEPTVKKKGRHKKQSSPDINFKNKRHGRLISRKMRNRQRENEKSIPVIEIDDIIFIEDDIDDQILGNDIDIDTTQFDFISNLPPFLKKQEGFLVYNMI
jgi:hypothetical protein